MKTAICFSGAIKSFDECICSTLKYFIEQFDNPDIFLHMWTFDDANNSDIMHKFKWRQDNSNIDNILFVLNPKKYVIEKYSKENEDIIKTNSNIDFNKFYTERDQNYGFNCCSMYWKIFKCFELMEDYSISTNVTYDLVIRARLDFVWEDYIGQKNFINVTNISDNKIFLIKDRYATHSKLQNNDKFFAGNFNTMKKMCNIFNHLKQYQDENILIEGQTINEFHIKKMNFNVEWIGNEYTYYKFMDRHKIISKRKIIFIQLNNFGINTTFCNDTIFINEFIYSLLNSGYEVKTNNNHIEKYNKINKNLQCADADTNIYDIKIYNQNNAIFVESIKKNITMSFSENILNIINSNNNYIIDFILSLLNNLNCSNNEYNFDCIKQINEIEPLEQITYKYLDHGYYDCEYLKKIHNDSHEINFCKKNIKISRKLFKIKNLLKYCEQNYLPIN